MRVYIRLVMIKVLRAVYFDTYHYLVVAKVRERMAVSKQAAWKFMWKDLISGS